MTLLFRLAEWHALAKLCMHKESTLSYMESVTIVLGRELRRFRGTTCSAFSTTELPKEARARSRKDSRKQAKASTSNVVAEMPDIPRVSSESMEVETSNIPAESPDIPMVLPETAEIGSTKTSNTKAKKKFNLSTYKFHAIPDYPRTIRMFGPTDSYSTQTVCLLSILQILCVKRTELHLQGELEHRRVKRIYGRTNKNSAIKQMTKHERRETRLLRAQRAAGTEHSKSHPHHVEFLEDDALPYTDVSMHHHISDSKKHGQDLFSLSRLFPDDPATKVSNSVYAFDGHLLIEFNRILSRV